MATIVVAPDSFKGSLSADAVAEAIASGWKSTRPDDTLVLLPQADGGEGTLTAIAGAVPGARRHVDGTITGPDGRPQPAEWLELPGSHAVVEVATTAGLPQMAAPDALAATTRGLGELIGRVLDAGCTRLTIGLGGSATTDGGAGALSALGLALRDAHGAPLPDGGAALAALSEIDPSGLRAAPPGGVELLSDVRAPLLGPHGAAAVFGPQKGASASDVDLLDRALGRWAESSVAAGGTDAAAIPGAGAAGGTGFGFLAWWRARVVPGAERIAELTGLTAHARTADLLITGEGQFDATSLTGKVVGNVLDLAALSRTPAAIAAGRLAMAPTAQPGVIAGASLTDLAGSSEAAIAQPERWLTAAGAQLARAFTARDAAT